MPVSLRKANQCEKIRLLAVSRTGKLWKLRQAHNRLCRPIQFCNSKILKHLTESVRTRRQPVTTSDTRACSICATLFPDSSESCPVCALRGALGDEQPIKDPGGEPTLSISQIRLDHYEILAREDGTPFELGRGAMGVTYKACDINLRRAVALKVVHAKFVGDESANRRLVREARSAASVRHANVASVFHLGKSDDSYFYAMEFVDGESLDKVVRRSGCLDPATALKVTALVAAGLEAIEKEELVHRDIKPSNIMVSLQDDRIVNVKIIDLGLAKATAADGSISEISTEGGFAGTPQYASPEKFGGVGTDIRSDLYSLGITLWEMLTGELPFQGSASGLIYRHQHAPLPIEKLAHLPQPVIALLEVLLEKDPAQRFQTPTELLQAIARADGALNEARSVTADQLRSGTEDPAAPARQYQRGLDRVFAPTRMRGLIGLVASIVSILGLLFVWFLFSGQGSRFFDRGGAQMAPTKKSIAVLPFENISPNKDDAYFADGVHNEILNNLAKIAQLKVISRTSVMQYRTDTKRDLRQIAHALGVGSVLEGTVRRDGNRVRISTELIDAGNDKTIWADSYDRDLTDIFAIQSEIAQVIASKLTATLSPEEKKWIEAKPTGNLEAYDLYLRAQKLIANFRVSAGLGSGAEKPLRAAIDFLDQAVQLDPKFTLAYCASAHAHSLLYRLSDPTPERRVLGDAAIDQAMRLQPDLPEVHLAYAVQLYSYRDYEQARIQLAIAERSLTNNAEVFVLEALIDRRQGNFEKAVQEFNQAIARDPRNSVSIGDLGTTYYVMRQFDKAEQVYDRLMQLLPDQPMLKVQKAFNVTFMKTGNGAAFRSAVAALPAPLADDREVLSLRLNFDLYDRDWPQAKEAIQKLRDGDDDGYFAYAGIPVPIGCYSILLARLQGEQLDAHPEFAKTREQLNQKALKSPGNAQLLSQLAVVDALLSDKEAAIKQGKRAVEMLPISKDAVDGPCLLINLAVVYAWTNEPDLAFQTLEPLTKTPGGIYYGLLKRDPLWDSLRKDLRFDRFLAELAPRSADDQ
jgi:serine/threonine protein kinase/Tfp pilus assembly protein PilF